MGDPQEKGDYHHAADRDEGEATGCSRGRRSRRRLRTPCHHKHNRRRRATGTYDSGGSHVCRILSPLIYSLRLLE